jgi:hypothetical protein
MAVYARRSRTRHKPAWRAKQRGPEAGYEREQEQRGTGSEPRRQDVDPVEPVGTAESNQPRSDAQPRK